MKIGIIDFDTSHVIAFTQRLNHIDVDQDQWVHGGTITAGYPGESQISPERIAGFTKQMTQYGIPLTEKPEDMIGQVDAIMVESVDGSVHLSRAQPFIEAGLPTYIDKPFACSLSDGRQLADLATVNQVPIFSSSSLRYAPEVVSALQQADQIGDFIGVSVSTPASRHPRNPGLFHYGIHGVEMLYTLMGTGCRTVWSVSNEDVDLVTGLWQDGRVGTVRGIRRGKSDFGFTIYGQKQVLRSTVSTTFIYRELLKQIVEMFTTGQPPLPITETLEIIAFIEAANTSARSGGASISLAKIN